jgi:4-amino-4-deoxy-L-arabinose transferase-like glycosyltransferase
MVAAIAVAATLAHVPATREPHVEGDEVVFLFLAARLAQAPADYHVRGALEGAAASRFAADTRSPSHEADGAGRTGDGARDLRAELLRSSTGSPAYDSAIYARPLFFHPPVYPYALAIARATGGIAGAVLLSAIMHGVAVASIGVLGTSLGGPAIGVLAALLTAIDPVLWLCGSRIWADATLAALCTAAMLAAVRALDSGASRAGFGAGVVMGLACLTKLSAVVLLPALVAAALVHSTPIRRGQIAAYAAGAALVVPWLLWSYAENGEWLAIMYPTAWQTQHYPYVAQAVERPVHFYVTGLAMVTPVLAFVPVALFRLSRDRWLWIPLVWVTGFAAALTALGAAGLGFQLRYLAPATPALCLLAAAGIVRAGRWRWLAAPLAAATVVSGLSAAAVPGAPEPIPYAITRALEAVGMDLRSIAPRLWRRP